MGGLPSGTATVEALLAPRLEQRILPGLERIEGALAALGHPERSFPSILVLGTNGKGSTAALLAGILREHGLRVGLYTSPHLVRVEERVRIGGVAIGPARLRELVADLNAFPELSYFETLTAAAFVEFAEQQTDVAVLEAGLGGRWDATTAASPEVTLLTNVGTDHQAWLGPSRSHVAAEKAAALRGREGIVGAWDGEVEAVIRANADPATPLSLASRWATVREEGRGPTGESLRSDRAVPSALQSVLSGHPFDRSETPVAFDVAGASGHAVLPLLGPFQLDNLELALAGAAALARHRVVPALRSEGVTRGVGAVSWPGRLQPVESNRHRLLLDGAHNREAVQALAAALDALGLSGGLHLLFSCLSDKPLEAMAALLRPRVTGVSVAPIESPRATPLGELAAVFPGCGAFATIEDALAALPSDRPVLVTGSLRLVGQVLARLEEQDG